MVKRYLQCLQRTCLPTRVASTEPTAPQDGQANRMLIPAKPLGEGIRLLTIPGVIDSTHRCSRPGAASRSRSMVATPIIARAV